MYSTLLYSTPIPIYLPYHIPTLLYPSVPYSTCPILAPLYLPLYLLALFIYLPYILALYTLSNPTVGTIPSLRRYSRHSPLSALYFILSTYIIIPGSTINVNTCVLENRNCIYILAVYVIRIRILSIPYIPTKNLLFN